MYWWWWWWGDVDVDAGSWCFWRWVVSIPLYICPRTAVHTCPIFVFNVFFHDWRFSFLTVVDVVIVVASATPLFVCLIVLLMLILLKVCPS